MSEIPRVRERAVAIPADGDAFHGTLGIPGDPRGLVVFAHGSGSSRFSPRNRQVAAALQRVGLATLLFDLLTPEEDEVDTLTRELRFDIPLLADRLLQATDWADAEPDLRLLPMGYFGSSTGAAAALIAAAQRPGQVGAVVSRGGRPDLAEEALPRVAAPTLLLVGGRDLAVLSLNHEAMARMQAPVRLEIVTGATHLFEEPGTLERVSELAADWFLYHLAPAVVGA